MINLRRTIFFTGCFFFFSCGSAKKIQTPVVSEELGEVGLFKGFNLLNIPRTNINIGAEWVTGIGPRNQGFNPPELLESQTLSNYDFQAENKFNLDLKVSLLKYLGLSVDYNATRNFDLSIDSASIVRVADLDRLNYSSGSAFVWEGIKVKSISLSVSKDRVDTISLKIDKVIKETEIGTSQGNTTVNRHKIDGLNLYTAYKLISFGEPKIEQLPDWYTYSANMPVIINPDGSYKSLDRKRIEKITVGGTVYNPTYEAKFYTKDEYLRRFKRSELFILETEDATKFPAGYNENCKLIIEITCNNEIINKTPKQIKYNLWCGEIGVEDLKFVLSSKVQQSSYILDQLIIRNLQYDILNPNSLPLNEKYLEPSIAHQRITIDIKNYVDTSVGGW